MCLTGRQGSGGHNAGSIACWFINYSLAKVHPSLSWEGSPRL